MSIKSTLSAACSPMLLILTIGATTNCGGVPTEADAGEVAEHLDSFITTRSGIWGANCVDSSHTFRDITASVRAQMDPQQWGYYYANNLITLQGYSDPHVGCDKNIIIDYSCSGNVFAGYAYTPAEANNRSGDRTIMTCLNRSASTFGTINVLSAVYGTTAHNISVLNQVNGVKTHCQGFQSCAGFVEYKLWGDPAPGSDKTLNITYNCSGDSHVRSVATVPAEANHKTYYFDCN